MLAMERLTLSSEFRLGMPKQKGLHQLGRDAGLSERIFYALIAAAKQQAGVIEQCHQR